MAITPLFNSTNDAIIARLKLTNATQPDTIAVVLNAVRDVRVEMFEQLGESRVTEIQGFPASDEPSSIEELTRAKAERLEVVWTKLILVQELPMIFMDTSGNTSQIWNEEALTRDASSADVSRLVESLETQVRKLIEDLRGSFERGQGAIDLVEPTTTPPRPRSTVLRRGFGSCHGGCC